MKITIIGTGYVGLVTGVCLADFGNNIICVDNDKEKVDILNNGQLPIYEPGLKEIIERNRCYKRIDFTTDIKYAVENSEMIFITVGTPEKEDGSADLKYIFEVAKDVARYMNGYKVVVDKSTVPIGTGKKVKEIIQNTLKDRKLNYKFDIVSNPEFLREGKALYDFMHPDRIVIGSESKKAIEIMKEVYRVLKLNDIPFIITNVETAEMIKYASNAFLAMKISYVNEIANLCEKVGADIQVVTSAMGKDGRISPKFLHCGPGYGGSCFPKDTKALAKIGRESNSPIALIESTIKANQNQKLKMVEKIEKAMKNVKGKTIAILGLAFKPETDDVREAPSMVIIEALYQRGAKIKAFDPQAMKEAKKKLKDLKGIIFCKDEYEAIEGADTLVIITEWNQFRRLDFKKIKKIMKDNYIFDLRNIYSKEIIEKENDFRYFSVGR
jgi:UDPglucose 6-dehydrogenase